MKEKLIQNLKMFIVGILLLIISFTYIKGHPGEWNSFVPSLQMLYYKGEIFFYQLVGKDIRTLESRQQLEKIYNELSYLVESSQCTDPELLQKIQEQQVILKTISSTDMEIQQYSIIANAQELKREIEETCDVVSSIAIDTVTTSWTILSTGSETIITSKKN